MGERSSHTRRVAGSILVMAILPYGVKVAQLSLAQLVGVRVLVGQLWGLSNLGFRVKRDMESV